MEFEQEQDVDFKSFIKAAYGNYNVNYPKFFKMDDLCKLALITSEVLLKGEDLSNRYKGEDIGIVIANSNSSLDTDIKHYDTIKDRSDYFPSPSVFVYTLPNIMIGEISIKNNIKGENAFFIFENFEPEFISSYVNNLLDTRSEEHTSELQSHSFISYAVFCLKKKNKITHYLNVYNHNPYTS